MLTVWRARAAARHGRSGAGRLTAAQLARTRAERPRLRRLDKRRERSRRSAASLLRGKTAAAARLFAYGDAHRYRLGINHTRVPVNAPHGVPGGARNYGRDGAMRFDDNSGGAKNYEPNSFDTPAQTGQASGVGFPVRGTTGWFVPVRHAQDDDFVQAGSLYRVMKDEERQRLIATIAGSLAQVSREDIIERSIAHFRAADKDYGDRLAAAVAAARKRSTRL